MKEWIEGAKIICADKGVITELQDMAQSGVLPTRGHFALEIAKKLSLYFTENRP